MSLNFSFRRYFWGLLLVGLGVLLLLDNLNVLDFGNFLAEFWPILLMIVGLLIIFGKRPNRAYVAGDIDMIENSDDISMSHTFGDVRLQIISENFSGGEISNVFGNIELDLEKIKIAAGEHRLSLNGVFGDIIIILPKKAPVSVQVNTSFGTVRIKDKSSSGVSGNLTFTSESFGDSDLKLNVYAHQTFGDIRVF